jgi:hypothetical protein
LRRPIRAASAAVLLAFTLAGCGGGSAVTPASHNTAASNTQRAPQSQPKGCTPDSYGYCLSLIGYPLQYATTCTNANGDRVTYEVFAASYELYHNGVAVREYSESNQYGPGCPPAEVWSPSDPSTDTGDPNLP